MGEKIKKILFKFYFFKYLKIVRKKLKKYKRDFTNNKNKLKVYTKIFKTRVYDIDNKIGNIERLIRAINYDNIQESGLIYYIDITKSIFTRKYIYSNLTIDYSKILKKSLNDYPDSDMKKSLIINVDNCIKAITTSKRNDKNKYVAFFENIKNRKANCFEEALQRILWLNQILWQTDHELIGLGRLDKILNEYYIKDIKNKNITKKDAKALVKNFITLLHENYWYKSASLMGDTGQIIILGGLEEDGSYFYNDLTYIFIDVIKELQIPDPKTLLRVSNKTPKDLIECALNSIKTGIGCPLFSNDDIIISNLIEFGIDKNDAYNYVTSACWEPFIPGIEVAQNNIASIVFIKPFLKMIESIDLSKLKSIDMLLEEYKPHLEEHIKEIITTYNNLKYNCDPLLSMFTEKINEIDISLGATKYNNVGLTGVSMANLVNSIINIDKFVFNEKKYTLEELEINRKNNYNSIECFNLLKNNEIKYGKNDKKAIEITNKITMMTSEILNNVSTKFGGKYKFGLSAPSYIDASVNCPASYDGRKNFEPFSVHISNENSNYIELIQFASKLDYSGNRINGNVVDFVISPTLLEDNMDKFCNFIISSIKEGFYQMQMNVISSDILIRAKEDPKLFPNLIVRVWGFSSYFNELPEEYKNLIIERTLKSEGKL